jgi:hypothetical protein
MEKEKESESKYMSDHNRDSYSRSSYSTHRPDSAHRYSENEDAVTLEVPMQHDSLATGLQQAAGTGIFGYTCSVFGEYKWMAGMSFLSFIATGCMYVGEGHYSRGSTTMYEDLGQITL